MIETRALVTESWQTLLEIKKRNADLSFSEIIETLMDGIRAGTIETQAGMWSMAGRKYKEAQ
jgi:predicted CopG family antitoxin